GGGRGGEEQQHAAKEPGEFGLHSGCLQETIRPNHSPQRTQRSQSKYQREFLKRPIAHAAWGSSPTSYSQCLAASCFSHSLCSLYYYPAKILAAGRDFWQRNHENTKGPEHEKIHRVISTLPSISCCRRFVFS